MDEMNEDAGPALHWPFRVACGALGAMVTWFVLGITADGPVTTKSEAIRVLSILLLPGPLFALAVFGAGRARPVPVDGEDALDAAWERAHPWRARMKWLITVVAGAYGAVRVSEAIAAGHRVPIDGLAACLVGALTAAALLRRLRRRRGNLLSTTGAPASLGAVPAVGTKRQAADATPSSRATGFYPSRRKRWNP